MPCCARLDACKRGEMAGWVLAYLIWVAIAQVLFVSVFLKFLRASYWYPSKVTVVCVVYSLWSNQFYYRFSSRKYVGFWSKKRTSKDGGKLQCVFNCCIKSWFLGWIFGGWVGWFCMWWFVWLWVRVAVCVGVLWFCVVVYVVLQCLLGFFYVWGFFGVCFGSPPRNHS